MQLALSRASAKSDAVPEQAGFAGDLPLPGQRGGPGLAVGLGAGPFRLGGGPFGFSPGREPVEGAKRLSRSA